MPGCGSIRTIGAITVKLSLPYAGHEDVPVMRGAMESRIKRNDPGRPRIIGMVKEDDLQPCRIGGKNAEICSIGGYGRAQRVRKASIYLLRGRIMELGGLLRWVHSFRLSAAILHQRCHRIGEASRGTEASA